eukprot:7980908-Lingulodinium_polyedra.AAC.1
MKGCSRGSARAEVRWRLPLSVTPGFMRSSASSRGCGEPVRVPRTCRVLAILRRKRCHGAFAQALRNGLVQ